MTEGELHDESVWVWGITETDANHTRQTMMPRDGLKSSAEAPRIDPDASHRPSLPPTPPNAS